MNKKIKIRDLVESQDKSKEMFEAMVTPYCGGGYSSNGSGTGCASNSNVMNKKIKIRDLVESQDKFKEMFEAMVTPYCGGGYSSNGSGTGCASGYSSNLWCVSNADESDEVLF